MNYAMSNTSGKPTTKLEALKERQAALRKQIVLAKARKNRQARKEVARLRLLVGTAYLQDSQTEAAKAAVKAVLDRTIAAERDRAFLRSKGWL